MFMAAWDSRGVNRKDGDACPSLQIDCACEACNTSGPKARWACLLWASTTWMHAPYPWSASSLVISCGTQITTTSNAHF